MRRVEIVGGAMPEQVYEQIGVDYTRHRQADQRIVALLLEALALPQGGTLLELGAGTGNYSRALAERQRVLALEPAATMRRQAAPSPGVRWIAGVAEQIPLRAASVDGVLCMLSVHHFRSLDQALNEVVRVCPAGPVAIFTFDPRRSAEWWLPRYFAQVWRQAYEIFPPIEALAERCAARLRRAVSPYTFALPHDLRDAFASAGWRRPEIYLDPTVRANMSGFALADQALVEQGVRDLARDLADGSWQRRYGALLEQPTLDAGYRLLLAR